MLYGYRRGWLGKGAVVRTVVGKLGGEWSPAGEEVAQLLVEDLYGAFDHTPGLEALVV